MRIVFTIKSINLAGGSERSTVTIANALVKRGHDVSIVSYTGSDTQPFFSIDAPIRRYYLAPQHDRYPVLIREVRRIVRLRKLYAQLRPDVIVVIGTTRAFVNVPATKGYPVIAKEYFTVDHRSQLTSALSRRWTARHAQAILTLSDYDAEIYRQCYGAKKAVVIPNPLSLSAPQPSSLQNKVVLGLGRMSYVKGFDLLLKAWQQVQHTDWELHLVGDGNWRPKLQQMVANLHLRNVCFYPATADVELHYRNASLFVLPSRSEAFGNVLLEAMSVGLPVVAFDCGAGPKAIIQDKETGIIVPAEDTAAMAHALDELMDNPVRCKEMSEAALLRMKQYDIDTIMAQWETLLTEVTS